MIRWTLPLVVGATMVWATQAVAKNDIRDVVTGQPLADALDTLQLDGARCGPAEAGPSEVCVYDERTRMVLEFAKPSPQIVEKIVYSFAFTDLAKVRGRLQQLYGLRKDRIEGEHKLFTGERLLIQLDPKGQGWLSIINDMQIRKDAGPAPPR